jgi:hypothetical protein
VVDNATTITIKRASRLISKPRRQNLPIAKALTMLSVLPAGKDKRF